MQVHLQFLQTLFDFLDHFPLFFRQVSMKSQKQILTQRQSRGKHISNVVHFLPCHLILPSPKALRGNVPGYPNGELKQPPRF